MMVPQIYLESLLQDTGQAGVWDTQRGLRNHNFKDNVPITIAIIGTPPSSAVMSIIERCKLRRTVFYLATTYIPVAVGSVITTVSLYTTLDSVIPSSSKMGNTKI